MRLINFTNFEESDIKKIFDEEFDPEVFLVMIDTFKAQVIDNEKFNNESEQEFIANLLLTLATKTPKFDFMLDFMEDGDRDKIKYVINGLDKLSANHSELHKNLLKAFDTL